MSKTATRDDRTLDQERVPPRRQLVPPPKLRRRPALVAAATRSRSASARCSRRGRGQRRRTPRRSLVARHTIERGAVIEADDLARVRISADPALKPVPAAQLDQVVGQRAAVDIAAGGMLTPDSFTADGRPRRGTSRSSGSRSPRPKRPGLDLQYGRQRPRRRHTRARARTCPAGAPQFSDATVVGVHTSDETGQTVVDLLVPHADAAVLAARAATGNVALVLDSRER